MDRYDFPYRPDMKPGMRPGMRGEIRDDYVDITEPIVPSDVKWAVALMIFAVLISFNVGTKVGALASSTQSARACQTNHR